MKTLVLVYFNAGGGHRSSALALEQSIREAGWPWRVVPVNLLEVLDPKDAFRRLTGMAPEDYYNKRLARGWTMGMAQELRLLQAVIRLGRQTLVRRLQQFWASLEPDMVVSLVPNFNRAMCESLASVLPGVPYVTILTDLADHPPHFWIERDQVQHFICGTPRAVAQARAMGHPHTHVHATSGMIIRPGFYRRTPANRADERRRLGLDPERPTGLVLFGGHGSRVMKTIAEQLDDVQLILVCGHNAALATRLRDLPSAAPHHVVEFTDDIPGLMQLSDFFIGKPGPGSLSEAVQQGLPVIVVRNTWTLPQERYNAQWVRDHQVGIVLNSFSGIRRATEDLVRRLDAYQRAVRAMDNRAVFEIPDILARILNAGPAGHACLPDFSALAAQR